MAVVDEIRALHYADLQEAYGWTGAQLAEFIGRGGRKQPGLRPSNMEAYRRYETTARRLRYLKQKMLEQMVEVG